MRAIIRVVEIMVIKEEVIMEAEDIMEAEAVVLVEEGEGVGVAEVGELFRSGWACWNGVLIP